MVQWDNHQQKHGDFDRICVCKVGATMPCVPAMTAVMGDFFFNVFFKPHSSCKIFGDLAKLLRQYEPEATSKKKLHVFVEDLLQEWFSIWSFPKLWQLWGLAQEADES